MKDARDLTDDELLLEKARIERRWDDLVNDPEFDGRGGSPFEWMDERLEEIEVEMRRRNAAAFSQNPQLS